MKMFRHFKNLLLMCTTKCYRASQLETYSLWSILINKRKLRSDYVSFTAKRYAKSVKIALAEGYQPLDRSHLDEKYWLHELRKKT
jgi:hypothetical protein